MYEAVQQRPTVITEGRTGVCMYFKLVFALKILERGTDKTLYSFNYLVHRQNHFDVISYLAQRDAMYTQFLETGWPWEKEKVI